MWNHLADTLDTLKIPSLQAMKTQKVIQVRCLEMNATFDVAIEQDDADLFKDTIRTKLCMDNEVLPDQNVAALHDYIQRQLHKVHNESYENFVKAQWKWDAPPVAGQSLSGRAALGVTESFGDWRSAYAPDGMKYWWNVKTRETSWKKPSK
jgi:hypothetical protein